MQTAVDNRKSRGRAMLEQNQGRHQEQAVDFARDRHQRAARVHIALQFNGEKEIGLILIRIERIDLKQGVLFRNFGFGELKQQVLDFHSAHKARARRF